MVSNYRVSSKRANWGVVGWSMGGTCAVDLTVMHPDIFSAFDDIAGDLTPNSGNKVQTIARLFGGNAAAYAAFDPTTVIIRHGPYTGVAGWFDINGTPSARPHVVNAAANPNDQTAAANSLCATGIANGIKCAIEMQPGKHDWPFAAHAFAVSLPWLAGQLGTPGLPALPLPAPQSPPPPQPAPPRSGPNLQAAAK
jgi:S-formylglutathione hydrolase FrmB